ncbi:MAG: MFS transporter [Bdellovibrionales bacterium]|nr:MFS transporter [Bdellovibrionales bacterium]
MASFKRLLAICYVGWMFDFYDLALFSFLLPTVGTDLQLSHSEEAWLLGIALGTSGLGGILFGWLADRYGRKPVMGWTILLFSVGTGLSALAHNATSFFILRGLTGLGIGGEWAVGHALVAESAPQDKRGRASAWLQSGEPAGVALAAIMGLLVAPVIGWRYVMGLSSLTALWALVVRKRMPESPLWENAVARNTPEARARRARSREWLRSVQGLWLMGRALLLATFKLGTYWTCYVWLPKFFITKFHEPIGRSAMWILTAQLGQFAGMMYFGRMADRHGRREAYTVYSILTAISLALLAFAWPWLLEHRPLFWLTMLGLGVGSGCTAGFGALLAELFPTESRNFAMGLTYNLARGAQIFAPFVVSYFAMRWDVSGALGVPLALAILTAMWVWSLPETRHRDLAHIES